MNDENTIDLEALDARIAANRKMIEEYLAANAAARSASAGGGMSTQEKDQKTFDDMEKAMAVCERAQEARDAGDIREAARLETECSTLIGRAGLY